MATKKETFDQLHQLLAGDMLDRLQNGVLVTDKNGDVMTDPDTGKPLRRRPTAAELNVIRQFLKDNNIDNTPQPGTSFAALAEKFPFEEEEAFH